MPPTASRAVRPQCRAARHPPLGVNRRGVYTSSGIPGTGLYKIRHVRSSPADPTVTGAAGGFLIGLLIAAEVIVVVAIAGFVSL